MKTKLFTTTALLLSGFLLQSTAQNVITDAKPIKSDLDEATVFFQGAELTHSATATLTKGTNEISIEGLSPNIDKNSLKINISNGVVISASEYSVDFLSSSKAKSTVVRKIQDSIDIYTKKRDLLLTDIKINKELMNLLQKGTDKNVSGSEKGLGIDELVKTMDYYKTKSFELQGLDVSNDKKKKELDEAIARLSQQLNQESLKNNKTSGILRLVLNSPAALTANLSISYYTAAANWVPFYDINIASTDKPIKITAKSKVRQTTGLDWEKVKLTLSTSVPSNGKIAPLFSKWFLQEMNIRNFKERSFKQIPAAAMQNSLSYADISPSKEISEMNIRGLNSVSSTSPMYVVDGEIVDESYVQSLDPSSIKNTEVLKDAASSSIYGSRASNGVIMITLKNNMDDYITTKDNDLNMAFNIDLPYTIPGNGKEQTIDLQTKEASAEYRYYCAPKLDKETYLIAEIPDWEKLNLLSGKANITYDGTYVGESFIDASSTLSKLALTLGSDKRVAAKREKMQDFSSTKFLGTDTKQIFTYKLTVKNNQNKTVKMTLKDQYPISTQKNIEVELLTKDTTPWTVNVEDLGVITWEEEFKPGETKVYQISYSVKYPKNMNLNL